MSNSTHARECLDFLVLNGSTHGLYVSTSKTTLWQPLYHRDISHLFPEFITSSAAGIQLLGSGVTSSPTFMKEIVTTRVNKAQMEMKSLIGIPDPQVSLLLLRSCLGMTKLNYCVRTADSAVIEEPLRTLESTIIETLRRIVAARGPYFGISISRWTWNITSIGFNSFCVCIITT